MATLVSTTEFDSTYVVARDVDRLERAILDSAGAAQSGSPYTVWFVGEAHNNSFDTGRRSALMNRLANNDRVLIAVERTFLKPGEFENAVVENNDQISSSDLRNAQIVNFVREYLADHGNVRTIVFFFGQVHSPPIQRHLLAQLAPTARVAWVACPDIDSVVQSRMPHQPAMFSLKGRQPVGYCDLNQADYRLTLLERGWVPEPFNLDVHSKAAAGMGIAGREAYALYFKNPTFNEHQRKMVEREGSAGVDIKRINGAYTVVAKKLAKADLDKADAGTLFA